MSTKEKAIIGFPKPVKTIKKKKSVRRQKKSSLAQMQRVADKLAGQLCRARGVCPACGSEKDIQWAHVIRRSQSKALRWDLKNCLSLCKTCHCRFTYSENDWIAAQMTIIELGLVKLEEVFLPYMTDKTGVTYFEKIKDNRFFLPSQT